MSKTIYVGVNSVARKVKQPYVGVGNVARKVKSGFVGVNGVARQFFSGGTPLSSLAVGSSIYLNENGSPKEYLVVHQGKPSSIYDDSCNGTWLLRKYIDFKYWWDTDRENYLEYSEIQPMLNSTMLGKYDTNIQNIIKQVKIPYQKNGGTYGTVQTGANGYSCKVFLLSGYEVGCYYDANKYMYFPQDGAKLDYFISGNSVSSADNRRLTWLDTTANQTPYNGTAWWLRSPYTDNYQYAWIISTDGHPFSGNSDDTMGVRPALIMPSDTLINPSTNTIIT